MPSAVFLFVVFVVVGPSDFGLYLTGALHYTGIVLKGIEREDGLYEVDIFPWNNAHVANVALSMKEKQELWHARLGNVGKSVIKKTIPIVDGIDIKEIKIENCEPCIKGKLKRGTRPSMVEAQAR